MSGGEAKAVFAIDLETGELAEGSSQAAKSLESLKSKIEADTKELRELQSQMKAMQGASSVNAKDFKTLRDRIQEKKTAVGDSSVAYTKLGGKLSEIGKKTKEAGAEVVPLKQKFGDLTGTLSGMPGPVGAAGSSLSSLGALMANPYVAAIALAAALAVSIVAITAFGVKCSDTARSARLLLDAITGSEAGGAKLGGTINQLSKDLPIAKAAITDIAKSLTDKGLQGAALESSLSAIARTTSVLGSTAGGKLQSIVEQSKQLKRFTAQALDFTGTGVSIDDVAKALAARTKTTMANAKESIKAGAVDLATGLKALDDATKDKLGASAEKMALSLPSIFERAKNNFGAIFNGLNIERVLKMLSGLVDIFDESAESGKALRTIVESFIQPLLNVTDAEGAGLTHFVKQLVIHALRLAIMFHSARIAIKKFAQDPVGELGKLADKLTELGSNIIAGIVDGIKSNANKVKEAVKSAVTGAVDSAKEFLGIKSPSLVFKHLGRMTAEGFAIGVDDGAPMVDGAVRGMFTGPLASAEESSKGAATTTSTNNRSAHVTNHFHIYGGDTSQVKGQLIEILEGLGLMTGALTPEAT